MKIKNKIIDDRWQNLPKFYCLWWKACKRVLDIIKRFFLRMCSQLCIVYNITRFGARLAYTWVFIRPPKGNHGRLSFHRFLTKVTFKPSLDLKNLSLHLVCLHLYSSYIEREPDAVIVFLQETPYWGYPCKDNRYHNNCPRYLILWLSYIISSFLSCP